MVPVHAAVAPTSLPGRADGHLRKFVDFCLQNRRPRAVCATVGERLEDQTFVFLIEANPLRKQHLRLQDF